MQRGRRRFLAIVGGAVGAGVVGPPASAARRGARSGRLYVGTHGFGVGLATVDRGTGRPGTVATAADTPDPSYLALAPDGRTLYAANELLEGTISAFAIEPDGGLRALGSQLSHAAHPAYVHAHPNGRFVLSANYTSGSVTVHPVGRDGALGEATDVAVHTGSGPDPDRQQGPHTHKVLTDPGARFVHAVDLGADTVFSYRLTGAGKLVRVAAVPMRPGAGPRHMAFHPSGRWAYVANELDATLTVCAYDRASGRLIPGQTQLTAPPGEVRNFPSEVLVSADGRFVYLANRGHNSVARFAVIGGRVRPLGTVPCGGDFPRHIALSRDGRFLYAANQRSADLATLRVNPRNGVLTPDGPALATGTPTMVLAT